MPASERTRRVVWKWTIRDVGEINLFMPRGAVPIAFQMQGLRPLPTLWAVVDPDAEREHRLFLLTGTGHDFNVSGAYVGTIQQGEFVWHLFERTTETP